MKKNTLRKRLLVVATVCCMCIGSVTAYADKVYESSEENDSKETAVLIQANNETIEGAAEGTYEGQYVVDGKASLEDTDWYKVYLEAGEQYMTCNDYSFDFEILDENEECILRRSYVDDVYGPRAFVFNVAETGFYYVKIIGVTSSAKDYIFMIGSPTYTVGTCELSSESGAVTMTKNGGTQTVEFDGTILDELPDMAMVYYVDVRGVSSTAVKSILLTNGITQKEITLSKYTWDKNGLIWMKLPVKTTWEASFEYYRNITFTPTLKMYYAYPILDTIVE